jgi:hypothetical protein
LTFRRIAPSLALRICGWHDDCAAKALKAMELKTGISTVLALVLGMMMVCPAFATAHNTASRPESHCTHEVPPLVPQQNEKQCCCDQNAIPVQALHPPFTSLALHTLSTQVEGVTPIIFAFDFDNLPFLKTSDTLTKLSTLRL